MVKSLSSREILYSLLGGKEYLSTHFFLIRQLGIELGGFFSYLLSHFKERFDSDANQDEWICISRDQIEKELGVSIKSQKRIIRVLIEIKFIETRMIGMPAKRHFQINPNVILAAFEKDLEEQRIPGGTNRYPLAGPQRKKTEKERDKDKEKKRKKESSIKKERVEEETETEKVKDKRKENSIGTVRSDGEIGSLHSQNKRKQVSNFDRRAVYRLREIVSTKITIRKNTNFSSWIESFRLLREYDGVEEKEIRRVLEWFSKNISKKFCPEAYSGSSFREKWEKLLSAIQRDEKIEPPDEEDGEYLDAVQHRIFQLMEKAGYNPYVDDILPDIEIKATKQIREEWKNR